MAPCSQVGLVGRHEAISTDSSAEVHVLVDLVERLDRRDQ